MISWLKLTDEQRRTTIDQAGRASGIPAKAIEKDWWVTLTLKALFQSAYARHLVFKGGTSLSKGWKLINRFSEDIDIALDPEAFEMKYEADPTKSYVERLKKKGCVFTSTKLMDELQKELAALGVPHDAITVTAEPIPADHTDADPQSLYVNYKSLYAPNPYIADQVKIEVSVRSLKTPFTVRPILSILSEFAPNPAYAETHFNIAVVEPRKTFLEKAFLLHEEFGKKDKAKIRYERMSRHFYDLVTNMDNNVGRDALNDHTLYDHLVIHRKGYSRISWVDYDSLGHSTISFLPPPEVLDLYREDYRVMREEMIHGEGVPTFDDLLERLKILQGRFRLKKEVKRLEDIINDALNNLRDYFKDTPGATLFGTQVVYVTDPYKPAGPANKSVIFEVNFSKKGNNPVFESILVHVN